jgi:hypothetical protein
VRLGCQAETVRRGQPQTPSGREHASGFGKHGTWIIGMLDDIYCESGREAIAGKREALHVGGGEFSGESLVCQ